MKFNPFALKYVKKIIIENAKDSEIPYYTERLEKIYDSYELRQSAILEFNDKVKKLSSMEGFRYYDVNPLISKVDGFDVKEIYLPASFDHHLCDSIEIRSFYWRGLLECLR